MRIPFNKPHIVGTELNYLQEAIANGDIAAGGSFAFRCQKYLEDHFGCPKALLTTSCTSALEMTILLTGIGPGDEVIVPSFTFPSTANAVAMFGGVPVFVDIEPDTLGIDPIQVETAIGSRTKAIIAVHYAGVPCAIAELARIAAKHGLHLIEDAAHCLESFVDKKPLGSFGRFGCLSFHQTKNVISGEGGALLINDAADVARAEIVAQKGTDRERFMRGEAARYSWQELGSSYLASELVAAFLLAQLDAQPTLQARRLEIWNTYHDAFARLEDARRVRRPVVPAGARHNGHIYYLLLASVAERDDLIAAAEASGIGLTFHFVPLHESAAGMKYGRNFGNLMHTSSIASRLVRLPIYVDLTGGEQRRVIDVVEAFFS